MTPTNDTDFFKAPRYLFRKHNILRIVEQRPDIETFVDVGCGAGELACTLSEMSFNGKGIDFSEDAISTARQIKKARGLTDEKLVFAQAEPDDLNTTFDLVIACEVLEHVADDGDLLRKLKKLSNKYVLVSVPAKMKYFDEFDKKVGHYRRYEKANMSELFTDAGLEVEAFYSYGFPFVNILRIIRKWSAHLVKNQESMEAKTKHSGVNPINLPNFVTKIDLEAPMKLPYYLSLPFNRFNLSEAYLVLGRIK